MDIWLFDSEGTPPEKVKEWVQPDLLVVCEPKKIGDKRIYGAPDFVVEVISSSTAKRDKVLKLNQYQKAGVRE
jgi:Uma2 family endonuclease